MTEIEWPRVSSAKSKKERALRAIRKVFVPTAATSVDEKSRNRSPKRSKHAKARSLASSDKLPNSSKPAPKRTGSRRRSKTRTFPKESTLTTIM